MKKIQRYNQGFGFFGPLEKCDTGKLAYYTDLESEFNRLKSQAESDAIWRIDAETWAEQRTQKVLELTATITTLRDRVAELGKYSDEQFERADKLFWDSKESDKQFAALQDKLKTKEAALVSTAKAYWFLFGVAFFVEYVRTFF
jgi:hypothetical protein